MTLLNKVFLSVTDTENNFEKNMPIMMQLLQYISGPFY